MDAFLGVDVGTQSVKGTAVNAIGELLFEASTEYPLYIPQPGWTEQSPQEMKQAAFETIRKVVRALDSMQPRYKVRAVCFTGQMHTMILLDESNEAIGVALLWNDGRAAREAVEGAKMLEERLGERFLLDVICNDFLANWTGAHLFYVKRRWEDWKAGSSEYEAQRWGPVWERARRFLTPRDYIVLSLCGEVAMDYCGGSETSLMDIPSKRWAVEAFEVLGIDKLTPPQLLEPGSVVGKVTKKASEETGLEEGTLVIAGAGDCLAGALAGGVLDVGQMLFTLGTSGVAVAPIGTKPLVDPQLRTQVHYSTVPNVLVNMGCVNGAGIGLRMYRDVLADVYRTAANKLGVDPYELLTRRASQVPPGSNGVMFSPYLTGDRLVKAPEGKGCWYGISAYLLEPESNGDACLVRAILEGVCFAVRDAIEIIKGLLPKEGELKEIRMVGGGARSSFWVQLAADIFGQSVCTTTARDASYGMALLAAVGAGAMSLREAASTIKVVERFEPRQPIARFYDALYRRVYQGHYDKSQRQIDEAMNEVMRSEEYREALAFWKSSEMTG
ncbi:MAG: FGGY family carbohydrate kinase [Armatimonadota bacterium]|nr:FGGY family carbohydrate kinase [Armatimonadota bacterium]MCX7776876.1 FGGY family carbohydrate kinase [Armatimonadota bacterium]MDW8024438.1 FGGY family carbohydrate kinase [Armatimonadota bacterium]